MQPWREVSANKRKKMQMNESKTAFIWGAYTTRNAPAPQNGDEIVATTVARRAPEQIHLQIQWKSSLIAQPLRLNRFAFFADPLGEGCGLIVLGRPSVSPWRPRRKPDGSKAVELVQGLDAPSSGLSRSFRLPFAVGGSAGGKPSPRL
jgi:hypothetical protein